MSVSCGNGQTYEAVVSGNGEFTPAHDSGSNSILVPTSFHDFHGVLTDSEGNVLDTEDEFFDDFKGSSEKPTRRATAVSCTFSISDTFEDPESGQTLTFTGSGGVNGFVTPARG